MSKKSSVDSNNYYLYPEWFEGGNESNQSTPQPTFYGFYTIQMSRKSPVASDNFCFYPEWFEGNQSNQSNQSQPSTSSYSYPTLEYIWSNAVRLTRATHSNLQDEIEYIEANLGGGGNESCNCSELEYKIDKNSTKIYYNSVNITSNANKIENLSDIKLSRDGSQPVTGKLICNNGLKTDIIKARTQSIIDCQNQLRVYQSLGGDGDSGLWLGSDFSLGAPSINLYPYGSSANGKIFIKTPRSNGVVVPRIEIPGKEDLVDIKIWESNIIPYDDNYQNLGSSSKRWKELNAVKGIFSEIEMKSRIWSNSTLTIGHGTSSDDLTQIVFTSTDLSLRTPNSGNILTDRISLTGGVDDSIIYIKNAHLLPYDNLSSYLGSTTHRWIKVFADRGSFAEVEGKDNLKLAGGDPSVGHAQIELHNGSAAPSPGALIFLTTNESGNPIERLKITGEWNIATLYVNKAHLEPYYDNSYRLGSSIYRWSDIYAVNTHWGDLGFVEDKCPKCNEKFKIGDNIVLKVIRFSEEDGGIMTIPIHLECAKLPTKTIRRKHPVKEKYYEWDERQGKVIAKWRIKKQKKKIKKKRLKPGYKINQKTGKIETSNRKNIELSEAIEEVEEEIEEIVYKEMEIKI